jgi:hypothetical protein
MTKIKVKLYKEVSQNSYRKKLEYFTTGKIIGKRIHIDKHNLSENQKNFYEYPLEYEYRLIDINREVFTEKVNTQLNGRIKFYCNLNYFNRLKLKSEFKKLWIQQTENIKWIITAIFALIGAFLGVVNFLLNCN